GPAVSDGAPAGWTRQRPGERLSARSRPVSRGAGEGLGPGAGRRLRAGFGGFGPWGLTTGFGTVGALLLVGFLGQHRGVAGVDLHVDGRAVGRDLDAVDDVS